GAGPCCRRAEYCVEHFASSSKRDRSCFSKQDERKIGRGRSSKTEVNQTQGCSGNASRFRGRIVFKFTTNESESYQTGHIQAEGNYTYARRSCYRALATSR